MQNIKTNMSSSEKYRFILKNTRFEDDDLNSISLPYSENTSLAGASLAIKKGYVSNNRICYQPMEGQDADESGSPTALTFERYKALAKGGAGIIWVEAVSVLPEGRSNAHQLMITEQNMGMFSQLCSTIKEVCLRENGFEPIVIVQLNHSGRYSKPHGKHAPMIAYNDEIREKQPPLSDDCIVTDSYLDALPDAFARSAKLFEACGFDGIDVKCCHGYLFSELLSAYERNGKYGGAFENRTRLLKESFEAVNASLSQATIRACRLNLYDNYNELAKFSFGRENSLDEANEIIRMLRGIGLDLLNATVASPYINPHYSRPYKKGVDTPPVNSLYALSQILEAASAIHHAHKGLAMVNTGVSGFCELADKAVAGILENDMSDFVGLGRMSFAYPDCAKDIINGCFDAKKCCVGCSGCSSLKKNGRKSGCIIRSDFYKDVFRQMRREGVK